MNSSVAEALATNSGHDGVAFADQGGRPGVSSGGLVRTRGQTVTRVGAHHQRGTAAAKGRQQAADAGPQCATEVVGGHVGGQAKGRGDGRGVGLVQIGR